MGGPNKFLYAYDSPINLFDPKGLNTIVLGAGVGGSVGGPPGAVIGAAIGLVVLGLGALWMAASSRSNPMEAEPGCELECQNKKGNRKQTRRYGQDGFPETDTDWDHNHDGLGSPHSHDWDRPADGSRPTHENRGSGRPSVPGDPGIP